MSTRRQRDRSRPPRDELGRFVPRGPRRDELGRFAPAPPRRRPRRDELGRFVPREIARRPAKKVERKPVRRPARKVERELVRKPARKPAKKVEREPERKPVSRPAKKAVRKSVRKPAKKAVRKPVRRPAKKVPPKRRRLRPERPLVPRASRLAEAEMQEKLLALLDSIAVVEPGLDMSVKTFVNLDGTVDGELRIGGLPAEWRRLGGIPMLVAALSEALRATSAFDAKPSMGGAFWASYGVRFGPQNESEVGEMAELYKRFRGLFQIGTYPTPAWGMGALQVALTGDTVGLRAMLASLAEKRGLPPSAILIRFVWTPDGLRPGHYRGEK